MFRMGWNGPEGTAAFTNAALSRGAAPSKSQRVLLFVFPPFIIYKWEIFKETGVAITTNPPQKLTVLKAL